MEVNRDESKRCIDIAIAALQMGNIERADKFLRKANSLFPSQRAKELLERVEAANKTKATTPPMARKHRTDQIPSKEEVPSEPEYSVEQLEMVRRIKRCKDYYEVLSVNKDSPDSDVKKAYKRLALQLHPDKNRAPGSVEAFKAVGNAVAVLTDAKKRKAYDLYGEDGEKMYARRSPAQHQHHENHEYEHAYARGGGFESDFTAEELFNMFFGGGFPQQRMAPTRPRYHNARAESAQQPSLAFCLILILIVISMLSSFFTSDPVYSLSSSTRYPLRRNTVHLNIPYYVKEKFESDYQGSLSRLESSVEEEYVAVMKQICFRERTYRDLMISRAKNLGSKVYLEQAYVLKAPSCENLAKLGLTNVY